MQAPPSFPGPWGVLCLCHRSPRAGGHDQSLPGASLEGRLGGVALLSGVQPGFCGLCQLWRKGGSRGGCWDTRPGWPLCVSQACGCSTDLGEKGSVWAHSRWGEGQCAGSHSVALKAQSLGSVFSDLWERLGPMLVGQCPGPVGRQASCCPGQGTGRLGLAARLGTTGTEGTSVGWGHPGVHGEEGWAWAGEPRGPRGREGRGVAGGARGPRGQWGRAWAGGTQGSTGRRGRAWVGEPRVPWRREGTGTGQRSQGSMGTAGTGRRGRAWSGGTQWLVWLYGPPGAETRPLLLDRVRGLGEAAGLRCWGINPPDRMGVIGWSLNSTPWLQVFGNLCFWLFEVSFSGQKSPGVLGPGSGCGEPCDPRGLCDS